MHKATKVKVFFFSRTDGCFYISYNKLLLRLDIVLWIQAYMDTDVSVIKKYLIDKKTDQVNSEWIVLSS